MLLCAVGLYIGVGVLPRAENL